VADWVGVPFLGTGGIGGVHRGFPSPPDVSADIPALARTRALVVSSGVKSLLDVPATVELLETLGVPVLGFRTSTLPLFYAAEGGPPLPQRVEEAVEAARIAAAHWELGGAGLLLAQPPPESLEVEGLIESAVSAAAAASVSGPGVTPFVLSFLHEHSAGRTREVNRSLIVSNARLAAETAVAYAAL
jgi:pseudouridylate synthase